MSNEDKLFEYNTKSIEVIENPADYEEDYYNPDLSFSSMKEQASKLWDSYINACEPSSEESIAMMFGDDWDGSYIDVTPIIENAARDIAWKMTMYGSLSEILSAEKNEIQDKIAYNSGLYQIQMSVDRLKNEYTMLSDTFTNFKDFGFSNGASNILLRTENILKNIELTASAVTQLGSKIESIISYIQGSDISTDKLESLVDGQTNVITSILSQENFGNLLSTFPQSVAHKFMNSDFVQATFTAPKRVFDKLQKSFNILKTVEFAPECVEDVAITVTQLWAVVDNMRDVINILEQASNAVSVLKSNIEHGNYIGVFTQVQGSCKFVEKTSQFAAQYPYNQAYETEGGHIFETDNTPGKERLHIQHCTGTDVEIAPNGDMVSKIKNDCQFIVEKEFQTHVKGNQYFLVDETAEIESKTLNLTAQEDLNISAEKTTYTTDILTLMSNDTIITNENNLTIATDKATSISSNGSLYITSMDKIVLDAPTIIIGSQLNTLISLNTKKINATSGDVIISASNTNIMSNTLINGDFIKLKGMISLN